VWGNTQVGGALEVCPHSLCPPLPHAGEGDYGVRKRSFRSMLKLRFSTPKGLARPPLPPRGRGAGDVGKDALEPLTPLAPLSREAGEGDYGVQK
jgi:hypothetical protein